MKKSYEKSDLIYHTWQSCLQFRLLHVRDRNLSKKKLQMTLEQKIARFVPTEISADISKLSPGDIKALNKIIEAAQLMDPIFLRQVWSGNAEMLKKLEMDSTTAGQELLHYFRINMGPWSLLDNNAPFIDGAPKEKPAGANYYPAKYDEGKFFKMD